MAKYLVETWSKYLTTFWLSVFWFLRFLLSVNVWLSKSVTAHIAGDQCTRDHRHNIA